MSSRISIKPALKLHGITRGIPSLHDSVTFFKDLWTAVNRDDCSGAAMQMSYNLMLSIPALIILLISTLAMVGMDKPDIDQDTIRFIYLFAPPSLADTLKDLWHTLREQSSSGVTFLSMLGTLWAVSNGASVIFESLDRAYKTNYQGAKPVLKKLFWYHRLFAVAFILLLGFMMSLGANLVLFGDELIQWLTTLFHLPLDTVNTVQMVRWLVVCLGILTFSVSIYAIVPRLRGFPIRFKNIFPGAFFFLVLWGIISWLFKLYVVYYGNYNVYGALGVFIIAMLWLNFSSLALLIGGEVNALLIHKHDETEPTKALL